MFREYSTLGWYAPLHYLCPRLDSVGIAGFSHDFGSLRGKHSAVVEIFDSFGKLRPTFFQNVIFILNNAFPILAHIPNPRKALETKFKSISDEISRELLGRTKKEGTIEGQNDYSVIGLLSML